MHALIENGRVSKYPYSAGDLRVAYPNTSFPASITDETFKEFSVYRVFFSTQPSFDVQAQTIEETTPVFNQQAQRWEQAWSVRPLTPDELQSRAIALQTQIVDATQARLDDFARTRNYDGILSAATYASSAVPKFQAEGQYAVNARDQTWATLYQVLAEVEAGTRPPPTGYADIEPLLPALSWPV